MAQFIDGAAVETAGEALEHRPNGSASTNWCFTLNTPEVHAPWLIRALYASVTEGQQTPPPGITIPGLEITDDAIALHKIPDLVAFMCQYESGDATHHLHIQGVLHFSGRGKRFTQVTRFIPNAHWEKAYDLHASIAYCSKQDTRFGTYGPYTSGVWPVNRSSRRDWDAMLASAKKGDIASIPADVSNDVCPSWSDYLVCIHVLLRSRCACIGLSRRSLVITCLMFLILSV